MERILILGPCGSGKSTLAARLGSLIGLPVIHLDQQFWRPGWTAPSDEEWFETVDELVDRPRWIMDGNYGSSLARRLKRADAVVILDFPRRLFFWRVLKRSLTQLGKTRADSAPGCPERIDLGFLIYSWTYRKVRMPKHESLVAASGVPVIRLRTDREASEWLASLEKQRDLQ